MTQDKRKTDVCPMLHWVKKVSVIGKISALYS